MRFELSIALKYLIPRWKQLSVAIISLVSVLVVSMVVWLVIVFLSVTEGLEKKWVSELVSLNAPIRVSPTDDYYKSYYYQIDSLSADADYSTKSIGQKRDSLITDPYDPDFDMELAPYFPTPDLDSQGQVKDLVKEGFGAIEDVRADYSDLKANEYEVSFGTLNLDLLGENSPQLGLDTNQIRRLSQVSYIASLDEKNDNLSAVLLPPTSQDYSHLLKNLEGAEDDSLDRFFANIEITELTSSSEGFVLPDALYPKEGRLQACALLSGNAIVKVFVPKDKSEMATLWQGLTLSRAQPVQGELLFKNHQPTFVANEATFESSAFPIQLEGEITFQAKRIEENASEMQFNLSTVVQKLPISGTTSLASLQISDACSKGSGDHCPLWVCNRQNGEQCVWTIPSSEQLGNGVVLSKQFQKNGVTIGDQGFIAYTGPSLSSVQEQKLPIYVSGFYDPGLFPMGNKLIFVDPAVTAQLRGNIAISDSLLGNGINVWLADNEQADAVKVKIQEALRQRGVDSYWSVQSFKDYEFARPILQQLKSDKNLFTLIAIIILVVACSNIVSMLILLVNDKRREIGILQSMGVSAFRISLIFGFCGLFIGFTSSVIGILLSIFTLRHLQSLVDFLSFLQGHDAFQAAFYGSQLPSEVSMNALGFVLVATSIISLIAAVIPAIKASKIRPSQILRAD